MVWKAVFTAVICGVLAAWGGLALADEYRADDFLSLDPSRALLSPQRLGPPAKFTHVPVEAKADRGSEAARPEPNAAAKVVKAKRIVLPGAGIAHLRPEMKPRAALRARLARRRSNPLNAQAFDTRIQVWPCKPSVGGLCAWRR